MMRAKKFVKTTNIFNIKLFTYICLMKVYLKVSTLEKKPELEVEVAKLLGQLYDKVTLMLENQKPQQEIASSFKCTLIKDFPYSLSMHQARHPPATVGQRS